MNSDNSLRYVKRDVTIEKGVAGRLGMHLLLFCDNIKKKGKTGEKLGNNICDSYMDLSRMSSFYCNCHQKSLYC